MTIYEKSSGLEVSADQTLLARAELYKRNPKLWIWGDADLKRQVFTQDEHDPTIAAKPFPDKEYLRWIVDGFLETRKNYGRSLGK
jgi:hypothetical protein